MRKIMKHLVAGFAAFLLLAAAPSISHADAVADFYKDKSIRVIISGEAGGTYDTDGRLIAKHLGKHIPGNPRMVAENMLGASGRVAANYLYNAAPKDGTVIAVIQQSLPLGQALGESGIQYDAARFNWIGSPVRPDETLVVWHTTGVKTMEDATKKEVIIGATTPTGMNYLYPRLANELLGTKFKIVTGYPGGSPIILALERGEVEGRGSNPWSDWKARKPDWVKEKKIVPLMQMSLFKHPDLPDVPLMVDLAPNDTARSVFELVTITGELGRPFLTAPGVPAERVKALRDAFDATVKDPEFLADAAKAQKDIHPIHWKEMEDLVTRVLSAPKEATDLLKAVLTPK
jgi:tripartite-type tricarboxylate transporter receptor subunit TctC